MRRKLFQTLSWLYSQAGMVATLSGGSFAAVVGAVSGYVAQKTAWIAVYGPMGWWAVALTAAFLGVLIAICVAHFRYAWIKASAINKWKDVVSSINPLDQEFRRKRISISDLVPPYTSIVENKTFIECEIIGPQLISLQASGPGRLAVSGCTLINVAAIAVKNDANIPIGVVFLDCQFLRCKIAHVLFAVPERDAGDFATRLPHDLQWIT